MQKTIEYYAIFDTKNGCYWHDIVTDSVSRVATIFESFEDAERIVRRYSANSGFKTVKIEIPLF